MPGRKSLLRSRRAQTDKGAPDKVGGDAANADVAKWATGRQAADTHLYCWRSRLSRPRVSSDLYDRGYGEVGLDFLTSTRYAHNIVTNPPYNCAEAFVARGVRHARRKFALLLRLAFLEGANRATTIFARTPPARVWVFSERITFYPKGVDPKGSGTTAYAWFLWDKDAPNGTELKWLKPGYKAKFS